MKRTHTIASVPSSRWILIAGLALCVPVGASLAHAAAQPTPSAQPSTSNTAPAAEEPEGPRQDVIPPLLRQPAPPAAAGEGTGENQAGQVTTNATPQAPNIDPTADRPELPILDPKPIGVDPADAARRVMIDRPADLVALENNTVLLSAQIEKVAEALRARHLEMERVVIAELESLEQFESLQMGVTLDFMQLYQNREKLQQVVFQRTITDALVGAGAMTNRAKDQNNQLINAWKDVFKSQLQADKAAGKGAETDTIMFDVVLGLLEARSLRRALFVESATRIRAVAEGAQLDSKVTDELAKLAIAQPPADYAEWAKVEAGIAAVLAPLTVDDRIAFLQQVIVTRTDRDKPLMVPVDLANIPVRDKNVQPATGG